MDEDQDRGVLERVAQGDVESFGVLVERYEERLLRLCHRFLGDAEEARDAAQEVFLKAFKNAASYQPRAKVYTWLYRIAVNHCLNRLRRRKVVRFLAFADLRPDPADPEAAATETPAFDPPDTAPGPAERLESRRRWQQTREIVDALPAGQRAVLVLAKFEGLSYREIAQTLNITESAVESRLFRAMRRVTESLRAAQNDAQE